MDVQFNPLSEADARRIVQWRYDPPYDLYNIVSSDPDDEIAALVDPSNHYYAVRNDRDDLIGFRCFGADARVPGGDYRADALDTGGGLRPDLIGRGLGTSILLAGLEFGKRMFDPSAFRVTVATFNQRALRVCQRAGFTIVQQFDRPSDQRSFTILIRNEGGKNDGDQT